MQALQLHDATLRDLYHSVSYALSINDRMAAVEQLGKLKQQAPTHPLRWQGERALAAYDGDGANSLTYIDELLKLYPNDIWLVLAKSQTVTAFWSRKAQIEWLREQIKPYQSLLQLRLAKLLSADSRDFPEAFSLIKTALRYSPTLAEAWWLQANLLWVTGQQHKALEHYKIAACLQESSEEYALSYFRAAKILGNVNAGLTFLKIRSEKSSKMTAIPALTLIEQLDFSGRTKDAFEQIKTLLRARREDGDLYLYAAQFYYRYRRHHAFRHCITIAGKFGRKSSVQLLQATHFANEGKLSEALNLAQTVLAQEPQNMAAVRLMARLHSQLSTPHAAIEFLHAHLSLLPHYMPLHELYLEWLRSNDEKRYRMEVATLLARHPQNTWAMRECAMFSAQDKQWQLAEQTLLDAIAIEPNNTYNYSTLASLQLQQDLYSEARESLKKALTLSLDNDHAIHHLFQHAGDAEQQQAAFDFIANQLQNGYTTGDSLFALLDTMSALYPIDQQLTLFGDFRRTRPDCWQAWIVEARLHRKRHEMQAALTLLESAIQHFPFIGQIQIERANVLRASQQSEQAKAAALKALELNPSADDALRLLVELELSKKTPDFSECAANLKTALLFTPHNVELLTLHAFVLGKMQKHEEASVNIERALMMEPEHQWAWQLLLRTTQALSQHAQFDNLLLKHLNLRPGNAALNCRCAEMMASVDEQVRYWLKAIALAPRWIYPRTRYIELLLQQGSLVAAGVALGDLPWAEPPYELAVLRAKLLYARGKHSDAIGELKQLLKLFPRQLAGWMLLADWHDAMDNRRQYLRTVEKMIELAPFSAIAHGYMGDALRKMKDNDKAKTHFLKAYEYDRNYLFAAVRLLVGYFHEKEYHAGATLYADISQRESSADLHFGGIRCLLRLDLFDDAEKAWQALIQCQDVTKAHAHEAFDFAPISLRKKFLAALKDAVHSHTANKYAFHFLLEKIEELASLADVEEWVIKVFSDERYIEFRAQTVAWMAHHKRGDQLLTKLLTDYPQQLRQDVRAWGMVGYAWLQFNQAQRVIHWMHDWQQRKDAPPWSLNNLAQAYRLELQFSKALEINNEMYARYPNDLDTRLWLAFEALRTKNARHAANLLEGVMTENIGQYYAPYLALFNAAAKALIEKDVGPAAYTFDGTRCSATAALDKRMFARVKDELITMLVSTETSSLMRIFRKLQMQGWRVFS